VKHRKKMMEKESLYGTNEVRILCWLVAQFFGVWPSMARTASSRFWRS
jgi:hypothetical protein